MKKLTSKEVYFFATFLLDYFIVLPFLILHVYLLTQSNFKWIPHIILLGLFSLGILRKLSHSRFDKIFFSNPIFTHWVRSLPELRTVYDIKFFFDEKIVNKNEMFIAIGIFGGFFVLPLIALAFRQSPPPLVFFLGLFGFIAFMFAVINISPLRMYLKQKTMKDPKPYWYCFGYMTNFDRQNHHYKRSTSELRKHSKVVTLALSGFALLLGIDVVLGGPLFLNLIGPGGFRHLGSEYGFLLLEFGGFYVLTKETLKYFYLDELIEDIKKMPTP